MAAYLKKIFSLIKRFTIFVLIISFINVNTTAHTLKNKPCTRMQPTFIGKLIILPFAGQFYVMKKIIWKDVYGFKGLYMVSNNGQVKSLARTVYDKHGNVHYKLKELIRKLKTKTDEDGYFVVRLRKNSKSKLYLVHRLVANAFITNPKNKPFVNHKNGIKTDNIKTNLEWCTKSENELHAHEHLGKVSHFRGLYGGKHPRAIPIIQSDKDGTFIKRWDCASSAERIGGFSRSCVTYCARGTIMTHKGFKCLKLPC